MARVSANPQLVGEMKVKLRVWLSRIDYTDMSTIHICKSLVASYCIDLNEGGVC